MISFVAAREEDINAGNSVCLVASLIIIQITRMQTRRHSVIYRQRIGWGLDIMQAPSQRPYVVAVVRCSSPPLSSSR